MSGELVPRPASIQPEVVHSGGPRPTTVWGLTRGSYSDYRICAIFERKEDAEAALNVRDARIGWGGGEDVEEFSFYPAGGSPLTVTTHHWTGEFTDAGDEPRRNKAVEVEWEYNRSDPSGPRPSVRFVRAPIHRDKGGRLEVRGTDLLAVQHAWSDNVARIRANVSLRGKAEL